MEKTIELTWVVDVLMSRGVESRNLVNLEEAPYPHQQLMQSSLPENIGFNLLNFYKSL